MGYPGTPLAALNADLKEFYSTELESMILKNNPLLAMVKKNTKAGGEWVVQPTIYAANGGTGTQFANAQANQSATGMARFQIPLGTVYGLASTSMMLIDSTENSSGGFENAHKLQCDAILQQVANKVETQLYRATPTIGAISSISSGGVIVLTNPADAANFYVNQILDVTTTDGGAIVGSSDPGQVFYVDQGAGSITIGTVGGSATNAPGGGTTWVATNFLVVDGDAGVGINSAASPTIGSNNVTGLTGWLPLATSRPTASDSFFGVNRFVSSTLLAGVAINGSGISVKDAVIRAANQVFRFGGRPESLFINVDSYNALLNSMEGQKQFIEIKAGSEGQVSFSGVELMGPAGVIRVIPAPLCPARQAFMLELDSWTLYSAGGGAPRFQPTPEGDLAYRMPTSDAVETRVVGYYALGCSAPGHNASIMLSA